MVLESDTSNLVPIKDTQIPACELRCIHPLSLMNLTDSQREKVQCQNNRPFFYKSDNTVKGIVSINNRFYLQCYESIVQKDTVTKDDKGVLDKYNKQRSIIRKSHQAFNKFLILPNIVDPKSPNQVHISYITPFISPPSSLDLIGIKNKDLVLTNIPIMTRSLLWYIIQNSLTNESDQPLANWILSSIHSTTLLTMVVNGKKKFLDYKIRFEMLMKAIDLNIVNPFQSNRQYAMTALVWTRFFAVVSVNFIYLNDVFIILFLGLQIPYRRNFIII